MKKWLLGLIISFGLASAADLSFTGTFSTDDDVQTFNFTITTASTVTLRTWSYAGGTNANGDVINAGGFDPILALFDSSGELIDQNDDGSSSHVAADPVTNEHWDTYLQVDLTAGTYTVAVMQYSNFANGPNISNGFSGSGTTGFVDDSGDTRTNEWAFDILNVDSAEVEVPGAVSVPLFNPIGALLLSSLMGFFGYRRLKAAPLSSN